LHAGVRGRRGRVGPRKILHAGVRGCASVALGAAASGCSGAGSASAGSAESALASPPASGPAAAASGPGSAAAASSAGAVASAGCAAPASGPAAGAGITSSSVSPMVKPSWKTMPVCVMVLFRYRPCLSTATGQGAGWPRGASRAPARRRTKARRTLRSAGRPSHVEDEVVPHARSSGAVHTVW
jgi:hypothetical protein